MTEANLKTLKVLVISTVFPINPLRGDSLILRNLLLNLPTTCEVDLITLAEEELNQSVLDELKKVCLNFKFYIPKLKPSSIGRFINLFSLLPYETKLAYMEEMADGIKRALSEKSYDLIHFHTRSSAIYRELVGKIPSTIYVIDSMTLQLERIKKIRKGFFNHIVSNRNLKKNLNYEKRYSTFDRCFFVSKADDKRVLEINEGIKTSVIPIGVHCEYFMPGGENEEPDSIVFSGNMSYSPNIDAVLYFCSDILPLIKKEVPSAKFTIAGGPSSKRIVSLENDYIKTTGYVEDIRPYLAKSSVVVSPMRYGSGIKIKVLEAMAMGKAIVTTPLGHEGIPVDDESVFLIGKDPYEFAQKVIGLLHDSEKRRELGKTARVYVVSRYSWAKVARQVEGIWRNILSGNNNWNNRDV